MFRMAVWHVVRKYRLASIFNESKVCGSLPVFFFFFARQAKMTDELYIYMISCRELSVSPRDVWWYPRREHVRSSYGQRRNLRARLCCPAKAPNLVPFKPVYLVADI